LGAIETQAVEGKAKIARRKSITEYKAMPPHGSKRQLMVPGGLFMAVADSSRKILTEGVRHQALGIR
jgi:hypothetical protein